MHQPLLQVLQDWLKARSLRNKKRSRKAQPRLKKYWMATQKRKVSRARSYPLAATRSVTHLSSPPVYFLNHDRSELPNG
uniref:Uncharacterized protein n=1 Tax=uncultured marine virus TaxID=186617 RepID=A0A0F7L8E1_9VIRU|nr:hypothetical protein [uncultured marine virus]